MPPLNPLVRSLTLSVLLHVLVLGLFAFGVSRGHHEANHNVSRSWVEFAADVRPQNRPQSRPTKSRLTTVVNDSVKLSDEPVTAESVAPVSAENTIESSSASAPEFQESAEARYITELATLLNRNKRYPRESVLREQEGKVVIAVSVDHDGLIHEKQVEVASPFRLLNDAALETVSRIGRFPAPPTALLSGSGLHGAGSLRLKIPIAFRIERR